MEMPEGWKRKYENRQATLKAFENEIFSIFGAHQDKAIADVKEEIFSLDLMREMAKALEKTTIIYYPAGSSTSPDAWKIIKDHNDRAFEVVMVLQKFKEWK